MFHAEPPASHSPVLSFTVLQLGMHGGGAVLDAQLFQSPRWDGKDQ